MALPLIALAIALVAEIAPHLVKWIAGDQAGERAEQIIGVAQQVTGLGDAEQAVAAVKADSALVLQFNQRMAELDLEYYRQDTERFREIHQTIRAELSSQDPYNRRWRATFGYNVAFSWGLMFLTLFVVVIYSMIGDRDNMASNILAVKDFIAATWELWGVALLILGYTIKKRSEDKHVAAGEETPGMLEKLIAAVKK